ncbi:MAG: septum formation initiator family protein [Brachymonas sp.]|nr:septum formation initiator family protein [Brachymonas sp.]
MASSSTRYVVPLVLLLLLGMVQYQIWTGRGSMHEVTGMQQKLVQLRAENEKRQADIDRLRSEIRDLKEGLATVEEQARYEMGMVKSNEIFVQISP